MAAVGKCRTNVDACEITFEVHRTNIEAHRGAWENVSNDDTLTAQMHTVFPGGLKLAQLERVAYVPANHPMNTTFSSHQASCCFVGVFDARGSLCFVLVTTGLVTSSPAKHSEDVQRQGAGCWAIPPPPPLGRNAPEYCARSC